MSTAPAPSPTRRQAQKSERRAELIEATIDCLAKHGYEATTVAVVAEAVGMSRGIVNFHFDTKQKLLLATLRHLSDEYRAHWRAALTAAGPSPAARLWALAAADFDKRVCTPRKLAAWCAFWGEAKSRPTYREMCGANDEEYQGTVIELCTALAPPGRDPVRLARGIVCMLEGLWLHLLMAPRDVSREEAREVALSQLRTLLPQHFGPDGPVAAEIGEAAP